MPKKNRISQDARTIQLDVDGKLWHQVLNFNHSASHDHHYLIEKDAEGNNFIVFGDGEHGACLPSEAQSIRVSYNYRKTYSGVAIQQGRISIDNDWNEGGEGILRPKDTIDIKGKGSRFSGDDKVEAQTHTISDQSYDASFNTTRNKRDG